MENSITFIDNSYNTSTELSMRNDSVTMDEVYISRLNGEELARLIPLLVYLGLIAFTGIPGNIIICLSYRKSSQKSSSRFFIWWLAIVDTISCFILFLEIVNVVHQFNFPNGWLCKLTIFSTLVPILTSGCSLCLISIDRFLRVCRPLKPQITVIKAKKMCAITVGVSLFFSWPSLILYGMHEMRIPGTNATGWECTIQNKYENSTVTQLYQSALWLLFITSLVFLAVMYILIIKRIFSQMNTFGAKKGSIRSVSRDISIGSFDDTSTETSNHQGFLSQQNLYRNTSDSGRKQSSVSSSTGQLSILQVQRKPSVCGKSTQRQTKARKSAIVMCIISVVFIISFLPYLMLRAFEAFNDTFLVSMSDTERALYKTFLRTYFLNCAINPFIYCACAETFRHEVRAYFRHVLMKFR